MFFIYSEQLKIESPLLGGIWEVEGKAVIDNNS